MKLMIKDHMLVRCLLMSLPEGKTMAVSKDLVCNKYLYKENKLLTIVLTWLNGKHLQITIEIWFIPLPHNCALAKASTDNH